MRRAMCVLAALLLVAGGIEVATPTSVLAHAQYERSTPAADSKVRAPESLDVWFTQELFRRAGANTLRITSADGRSVGIGEATIDAGDRKHLSIALLPGIAPGLYTVAWTSLSATDGDEASGMFTFTVDPNAPAAATPAAATSNTPIAAAPQTSNGSSGPSITLPVWSVVASALTLLAVGIGWWAITPRNEARR